MPASPPRPAGCVGGPSAWTADSFDHTSPSWRSALPDEEINELEQAARQLLRDGTPLERLHPAQVPLPRLSQRLAALRETLLHGVGFAVLTGLPIDGRDTQLLAAMFLAAGAHLGTVRSQNAAGDLLGQVQDQGRSAADPDTRIYQTAERQTFHTDSADVVGLLCLNDALEGGDSLVVSAASVHDRLLQTDPALLALLFEPVATDRRGEIPAGADPWFDIPVLSWFDGRLTVMYQRQYIDSAQRFDAAPRLDAQMIRALDAFDVAANDPALHISMRLEPGDMQFVHNHSLLHDRTGFTDHAEPARRRHLFRLWLSVAGDRALPPVFAQRYGSITIGDRGGIVTSGTQAAGGTG